MHSHVRCCLRPRPTLSPAGDVIILTRPRISLIMLILSDNPYPFPSLPAARHGLQTAAMIIRWLDDAIFESTIARHHIPPSPML